MLPRRFRLKRSPLFTKTLASGKVLCSSPYFLVLGLPRLYQSEAPTCYGFIVSKKVSNKATVRNRMRRRLREALRQKTGISQPIAKFHPYIAVVFIARKGILEASYATLQQALHQCLESR